VYPLDTDDFKKNMWTVREPKWAYNVDNVELRYQISDIVDSNMLSWTYWDINCKEGGKQLPQEGLGYKFKTGDDGTPIGDGTGTRWVHVIFDTNNDMLNNTDIFKVGLILQLFSSFYFFIFRVNFAEL
jgi:hypothetical protein